MRKLLSDFPMPPKEEFLEFYNKNILKDTAAYYNVSTHIIKRWLNKYETIMLTEEDKRPWEQKRLPNNFVHDSENRKDYIEWFIKKLGCKDQEDLYKIKAIDFTNNNGSSFLKFYNNSPMKAIMESFPNLTWYKWKFHNHDRVFENDDAAREYIFWLMDILGWKDLEDLYNLKKKHLVKNYGSGLFVRFGGAPTKVVMTLFPDHEWLEWKFAQVCVGFWKNKDNRLRFMIYLYKMLGYKKMEDWYKVRVKDFAKHGGGGMLASLYDDSPAKAILDIFSEYEWLEWKFTITPRGFFDSLNNRKKYMNWLFVILGYKKMEDWYNLTCFDLKYNYGSGMGNSGIKAVMSTFPEYNWDITMFHKGKKRQKSMFNIIKKIYPDAIFNYKHPNLRFSKSKYKMELDIYIPSLNIAIEYQDGSHFFPMYGDIERFRQGKERDAEKVIACKNYGIKLIVINYWSWKGDEKYIYDIIEQTI